MKEQDYIELKDKVDRYGEYKKILDELEWRLGKIEENGISRIITSYGYEFNVHDEFSGYGLFEMLGNKIIEAYKEQIEKIKSLMEDL